MAEWIGWAKGGGAANATHAAEHMHLCFPVALAATCDDIRNCIENEIIYVEQELGVVLYSLSHVHETALYW